MAFGDMKQKPRIEIKDVFAWLFLTLGYILFLTSLHILTITSIGAINEIMQTTFIIFLRVFETIGIIAIAFIIIHFLKILVWYATTPEWIKRKSK